MWTGWTGWTQWTQWTHAMDGMDIMDGNGLLERKAMKWMGWTFEG